MFKDIYQPALGAPGSTHSDSLQEQLALWKTAWQHNSQTRFLDLIHSEQTLQSHLPDR